MDLFDCIPEGEPTLARRRAGDRQRELHVPCAARLSGRHRGEDVSRRARPHQRRKLLRNLDERRKHADGAAKIVWIDLASGRRYRCPMRSPRRSARSSGSGRTRPAGRPTTPRRPGERGRDRQRTALAAFARAHRAANITEFTRRVAAASGTAATRLRGAVALVERRARGVLARASGTTAASSASRGARTLVDPTLMPGAKWFPDARLNFAENLLARRPRATTPAMRSCSAARTSTARRVSHAELVRGRLAGCRGAQGTRASPRAIASPRTCRTCPRPSSRCSARRVARRDRGRRARPISACRACSTASARSSRACSSPSMATGTTARRMPIGDKVAEIVASAAHASSASSSFRTSSSRRPRVGRRAIRARCDRLGSIHRAARRAAASNSRGCRSTIRSTSCIRRGRPASRSASCTAPAGRCSST